MRANTWKSIGAVTAGVLFIIAVTTIVDLALHAAGIFPSAKEPLTDTLALVASAYRLVIGIAGGWLAARLAPDRPMRHAIILGFVGVVLGTAGVIVTWNLGLGPRWYPVSLVVLAIPQCWLGGWLYSKGLRAQST
ncbi:MAG TPA: hypothetical protein VMM36_14870 [Opitutaceae bacterium]|nr:hypothetical protein [Opitutaceae bacterium]